MARATTKKSVIVSLELDEEEAMFLADILSRISGDPEKGRRGIQRAISIALANTDVSFSNKNDIDGTLHVKDSK